MGALTNLSPERIVRVGTGKMLPEVEENWLAASVLADAGENTEISINTLIEI